MADPKSTPTDSFKGFLHKWTNYIKGYQRRWFVLSNGLLSYYRNPAEMAHTCRGTINLCGADITTEDTCLFIISSGTQTYHLKAASEIDRQRWVTVLELAKAKAIKMMDSNSDDEDEVDNEPDRSDVQNTLRTLSGKLEDLATCNDLIAKHGTALQRSLGELEVTQDPQDATSRLKSINERATLFRITSSAMINACAEYLDLAQSQGRKWQKALQHEREQRTKLEETLETLAKQHNHLERVCRSETDTGVKKSDLSDDEFADALEDLPQETTTVVSVPPTYLKPQPIHRRTDSGASVTSVASTSSELYDDVSSTDEDEMSKKEEKVITFKSRMSRSGSDRSFTSSDESASVGQMSVVPTRKRRLRINPRPNYSLNLWSVMKNCIGKELSKIPMPINFNEPLSMLQRLTEDLDYADILNKASTIEDSCEQLAHVAAFTVSSYGNTTERTGKPFNPLLGETFECDRQEDLGWRSLSEQVSHHPPALASHAEGRDWEFWQEFSMSTKFRGKYLVLIPQGIAHLKFKRSGNHYTWRKVTTTVHNIIVGKLWVDQSGEMDIFNHKTRDNCHLKYFPYSYFSRDVPRKVTGVITDSSGLARYVVSGTWDAKMDAAKVINQDRPSSGESSKQKAVYQTGPFKPTWRRKHSLPNHDTMYYMTQLAITLNETEEGVAPTDSRNRPDQRLMEEGHWNEANQVKLQLEEAQRSRRRKRESESQAAKDAGEEYEGYKPQWFEKKKDPLTKTFMHTYKGDYWECKKQQDWKRCPKLFF